MYFKFLEVEDKNREMVTVAKSKSSYDGKILVMVLKHWYTRAYPTLIAESSLLLRTVVIISYICLEQSSSSCPR